MADRPTENPIFATNADPDDISEPVSHRPPGYQFQEEIPNEHFNWLNNTVGKWIQYLDRNGGTVNSFQEVLNDPFLQPGDIFYLDSSSPFSSPPVQSPSQIYQTSGQSFGIIPDGENCVGYDNNDEKFILFDRDLNVLSEFSDQPDTPRGNMLFLSTGYYWALCYIEDNNNQVRVAVFDDFSAASFSDNIATNTYSTNYSKVTGFHIFESDFQVRFVGYDSGANPGDSELISYSWSGDSFTQEKSWGSSEVDSLATTGPSGLTGIGFQSSIEVYDSSDFSSVLWNDSISGIDTSTEHNVSTDGRYFFSGFHGSSNSDPNFIKWPMHALNAPKNQSALNIKSDGASVAAHPSHPILFGLGGSGLADPQTAIIRFNFLDLLPSGFAGLPFPSGDAIFIGGSYLSGSGENVFKLPLQASGWYYWRKPGEEYNHPNRNTQFLPLNPF